MSKQSLRILTYNLHKGFNTGNRQFILHEMREALREADADIMLLQEIQGEHTGHQQKQQHWPGPHCDFIAEDMWPHFAYAKNAVYSVGHHAMPSSVSMPCKAGKISMSHRIPGPAAACCMV